ncbi:hypothetical protein D779_3135 [Imhoffiella purpurea]|uniref:Transposase IS200-like domain-containing protein n=1 Tax=Imhoffiella purpurea TaxID=1249627 RepID=W9VU99_9GAMM|nr:hypothetical protein D779_3135 [Imhoffiella purpurea]
MRYRRAFIPGGTFFFTLVTEQRRPLLAEQPAIDCLREAFRAVKTKRPFQIDAIVILPDHLHCVWTLPEGDTDFAVRWRLVKSWCTKHWPVPLPQAPTEARRNRGEGGCGSGGIGSMSFVTTWTWDGISITCISTR